MTTECPWNSDDRPNLNGLWLDKKEALDRIEEAKTVLFEYLRDKHPDVARVEVSYSGSCDEGYVDLIECHDKDEDDCKIQDESLDELIDRLFNVSTPDGFENNEGGEGVMVVDLSAKTIRVNHRQNIPHESTYEV